MKSTHNKAEQVLKEIKYPCLMHGSNTNSIILLIKPEVGFVVKAGSYHPLGEYSEKWNMENLTPLPPTESITLSND